MVSGRYWRVMKFQDPTNPDIAKLEEESRNYYGEINKRYYS